MHLWVILWGEFGARKAVNSDGGGRLRFVSEIKLESGEFGEEATAMSLERAIESTSVPLV